MRLVPAFVFTFFLFLMTGPTSFAQEQPHSSAADSDFELISDGSFKQGDTNRSAGIPNWANFNRNMIVRSRPGGAFVGGKFFLVGGEVDESVYGFKRASRVEVFDAFTLSWRTSLTDMPIPVSNISSSIAVVGEQIFVFGGWDENADRTSAIQVYNTLTDSWSVHPTSLNRAVYGCVALSTAQGILICGGSVKSGMGGAATDECFLFDPLNGSLNTIAPMPVAQFLHSGDCLNDLAVVGAGYGTGKTVQSFDLQSQTWQQLPDLPHDRAGCGITMAGNYCVFFGGNWNNYRADCNVLQLANNLYNPTIAAAIGSMPTAKRSFAYDDYQSPFLQVAMAVNGWANTHLANCTALY